MSTAQLKRHAAEIRRFVKNGDFVQSEAGVLIHGGIQWQGRFFDGETGETVGTNLITTEGMDYVLNAAIGADAPITVWYQALLATGTPAITWTANQLGTSFESKSQTEGYGGANRPLYTPGQSSGGVISSVGNEAQYGIVTANSVTFTGAAIVSAQARGSTAGVLLAASLFTAPKTFSNGDTWKCGYECKLLN